MVVRYKVKKRLENAVAVVHFTKGAEISLSNIPIGSDIDAVMNAVVAFEQEEAPVSRLSMVHCMIPRIPLSIVQLESLRFFDLSDNDVTGALNLIGHFKTR